MGVNQPSYPPDEPLQPEQAQGYEVQYNEPPERVLHLMVDELERNASGLYTDGITFERICTSMGAKKTHADYGNFGWAFHQLVKTGFLIPKRNRQGETLPDESQKGPFQRTYQLNPDYREAPEPDEETES